MLLDLTIRQHSQNEHSLDDVMRTMLERYPLEKGGYTVDDFEHVASQIAGTDLSEYFNDYVSGTTPLPWEETLEYAGVEVTPEDTAGKLWIGVLGENRITRVVKDSPAYVSGLNVGDEILALDGNKVTGSELRHRIEQMQEGDTVALGVFRNGRLRTFTVKVGRDPQCSYSVSPREHASPLQRDIYDSRLGIESSH